MTAFRRVAPTVAPVSWMALRSGLRALVTPRRYERGLERTLEPLCHPHLAIGFSSGRAALAEAIRLAMRATGRPRVVLPAYTSFSVAAAAAAAGAQVDLCDLDPSTLGLDRRALQDCVDDRTAAVLLGNLWGYPDRTDDLEWLRARGVLVIDDAAQALGATESGRLVGSRGELGVLSFGRGKCVTLGQGGALLVNDPTVAPCLPGYERESTTRGVTGWLVALLTRACTDQVAFGVLSRVPGARVGESDYDPTFVIRPASSSANAMALDLVAAVQDQLEIRRRVAALWRAVFEGDSNLSVPRERRGAEPAYLRVPVMAASKELRGDVAARLASARFRYVRSFPSTLGAIDRFRRDHCRDRLTPGAEQIAQCVIALPCHGGVGAREIRRAQLALDGVLTPQGPAPANAVAVV